MKKHLLNALDFNHFTLLLSSKTRFVAFKEYISNMKRRRLIKICKFGGSSVALEPFGGNIKRILEKDKKRQIVVVSAPGKVHPGDKKVTDLLISAYTEPRNFNFYMKCVEQRFLELASRLGVCFDVKKEISRMIRHFRLFKNKSYLFSRGEYLAARIFAKYLNAEFIDSSKIIKFTRTGKIAGCTYKKIIKALPGKGLVVVPGFYGSNFWGKIKVMSRGGSDITGAIIAKAISAKTYENWTDVDGVYSDFGKQNCQLIKKINFDQMRFLSAFGAGVLHSKCTSICSGTKIIIKNTFNMKEGGTCVENTDKPIQFAHSERKCVEFLLKGDKKCKKLIQKLKLHIFYESRILDWIRIGFVINNGYSNLKNLKKLESMALQIQEVSMHAYIISESKQIEKIKKEHINAHFIAKKDEKWLFVVN